MPEEECKHGLLPVTCSLCKPRPRPENTPQPFVRKPLFRTGAGEARTMTAKYDAFCENCGDDIAAGVDTIRYDEQLDRWVHATCFQHWGHEEWRHG